MTSRKSGRPNRKRQNLLQALEPRQMLAGPQLIGIQPNEGDLIVEGTSRNVAPRTLTFRFDEIQQLDTATLNGIQVTRSGVDKIFGTADDVRIVPGLVTLGDIKKSEVVMRLAESLPDDRYRIELFAFDDPDRGIVGLRNIAGEAIVPSTPGARSEIINFELNLGALVESIVPQPVVRLANGKLEQRRNEVLVYFNEDPLFVENDPATGKPTSRSAENPRFYQLLLTKDTVRTTDDLLFFPARVIYDQTTHTARLIFASDINNLPGVPLGGGSFRLRLGTAVDGRNDLIVQPTNFAIAPSVTSDLRINPDLAVIFRSKIVGEGASGRTVSFVNSGSAGLSVSLTTAGNVLFNLGGSTPTVNNLVGIVAATPAVNAVLSISFSLAGVANSGGSLLVPTNIVSSPPLVMTAVGDTITTSLDVGVFGTTGQPITSLTLLESIDPKPYLIELPGGLDDTGRLVVPEFSGSGLLQTINQNFGADKVSGITEIPYNFQNIFETVGGVSQLNQITINELYKTRIREALSLWASYIGVQFRETPRSGITFAFGDISTLGPRLNTQLTTQSALNASLRIDPTFANSAIVFSNQFAFKTAYGEDLFRKAMAGIGFLLGLEGSTDLTAQSLMSLNSGFLNSTINPGTQVNLADLEPSFPGNYDILHGQYIHRPESADVDLYRFEVNLGSGARVGTLTAETFAERLADSSSLDTTLTLFKDVSASVTTDFEIGTSLEVKVTSVKPGALGNSAKISYLRTVRIAGDTAIRVRRALDDKGQPTPNGIVIDVPRRNANVTSVAVSSIVAAINNDPFASTLFHAEITKGSPTTDISGSALTNLLSLSGGGIEQLARNDDYFSEDSLLRTSLANGVYYVGVAASGNNSYDPTITASGFGGKTQGKYQLLLKFEPQINESDTIRDLDSSRIGVPGTAVDGDGNGEPGGVKNFWFQTRPLDRTFNVTGNGAAIVPGQTFTITGANNAVRRFEFVPLDSSLNPGTPSPGNIAISYNPGVAGGGSGGSTPAANLATEIRARVNSVSAETLVRVERLVGSNTALTFTGERTIDFSPVFRGIETFGRVIFVDKTASVTADGSKDHPFNNISNSNVPNAFGASRDNDIVRIVGNGGLDNNPSTAADNFAYKIGTTETGGGTLDDGRNLQVPRGVTVMIDSGAAFKLRNSAISVGSTSLTVDRSDGAIQVLGTPRLVDLSSPVIVSGAVTNKGIALRSGSGDVVFTSTRDRTIDAVSSGNSGAPGAGNWGGLIFRRDLDQAEGRADLEDEGIFLQTVNHADIRFGGGANILIDSIQQSVNPIQLVNLRPTITFNTISNSANASMGAAPDSFEETSYQSPRFQAAGSFTADYDRVGPDINNNRLINNSINGLFVRVETTSSTAPRQLTVAGRLDDIDIVHYVAENIVIAGTPGGTNQDGIKPDVTAVAGQVRNGGSLAAGTYNYRVTFVDAFGFESLGSDPTANFTVTANSSISLITLPQVGAGLDYLFRRIYRRGLDGVYRVAGQLDASDNSFVDDGSRTGSPLNLTRTGVRGRLDGSLVIDPGTVVKFRGARIELGQGTQLLAEGTASKPIIFTSSLDDRFGAGGSFDTNNDINTANGAARPVRGDWAGIYAGPTANVSLDHTTIAYAGGVSLIEGGQSRGFDALELQQATGRITNSRFEFNANGQSGAGPVGRNGRLGITPATIFARFTQPTIVGNTFVDNRGSIIDLDSDSFRDNYNVDLGRQTGAVDRLADLDDNQGPLIRRNVTDSVSNGTAALQQLNGLKIRGGILSSGSVWDDTDIVHVLTDSIVVGNLVSNTGLRLKSRPDESLVVKMSGIGSPFNPTTGTGLTATGSNSNISDRLGGTVQVLGLPGAPVVLTSISDDTVGAGRRTDGTQQTDTNGDTFNTRPESNDWRSLLFDQFSNDRNLAVQLEQEASTAIAPGPNGTFTNAQVLGELADKISSGNETLRLGFDVQGFLSEATDIDVYSFTGTAGTPIWIDIDRTTFSLDTVIELLDANGNVVARVDNGLADVDDPSKISVINPVLAGNIGSLQGTAEPLTHRGVGGLYEDEGTVNPRDAGLRTSLPGIAGSKSGYFFRVRSASIDPSDPNGGLTRGGYSFQVRLQEAQEFPGSVVRFADIRYANNGIHAIGLPGSSPLLGEAQENESVTNSFGSANSSINDQINTNPKSIFQFLNQAAPGDRPQFVGNLANSLNGTFSVGGALSSSNDVDFYQFDVDFAGALGQLQKSTVLDIDYADGFSRPDTNISVFYDDDFETGQNQPRLILFGQSSNILDDQASPLGANVGEILARGSVSTGDPFIGPVSLPEGSYFVAITSTTRVPAELSASANPYLRREPINSIQRIFEDRVRQGATSTASGPLLPQMFTDAAITAGGFEKTSIRTSDPGHGIPQPFDNSIVGVTYSDVPIAEIDTGNVPPGQDLDATGVWTIADNVNIGGASSPFTRAENTSTTIPHTTVSGSMQFNQINQLADFYTITVPNNGTRVIVDLDNGFVPPVPPSTTGFNADFDIILLQQGAAGLEFAPGTNRFTTSNIEDGRFGSDATQDPFFDRSLSAGVYFIGVVRASTTVELKDGGISLADSTRNSGTYLLHVSVEDHQIDSIGGGGDSILFNRQSATASGSLVSQPFNLTGYVASDEPVFYYNYLYRPSGGDSVTVHITSDQDPTGTTLTNALVQDNFFRPTWRQNRVSLRDFAGQTNIRVTFDYVVNGAPGIAEGLYLDDFIVGFAERGETVFYARSGEDGFTGGGLGVSGEYQLEVRPGTEFATPALKFGGTGTGVGINLLKSFDTNDRQAQQITIVAPAGNQLADGDRFTLGDGLNDVIFEFSTDGNVSFGNVGIQFTATDTAAVVAARLIAAINNPATQAKLRVEAATASGDSTGATTDARVALSGPATGNFLPITNVASAPPAGTRLTIDAAGSVQLPAIYYSGTGDFNTTRAQGQVIIDSNRISDVRAVGILSQPVPRDTDPEDPTNTFLDRPPIGSTYPGAVMNLPTLNASVLGGLSSGVVVVNNIVDQAGFASVKVEGQLRPYVIDSFVYQDIHNPPEPPGEFGDLISDGTTMTIEVADTTVIFEFDDINGTPGGNGVSVGNVPIYYRRTSSTNYLGRTIGYNRHETMLSIYESIQGSILVTNGLAPLVKATLAQSLRGANQGFGFVSPHGLLQTTNASVYVEGATSIRFSPTPHPFDGYLARVYEPPQPVSRIINNTFYGADGTASRFADPATRESNDLLAEAIDTRAGTAHTGPYRSVGRIGDANNVLPGAADVDLFKVHLGPGDRLVADVDAGGLVSNSFNPGVGVNYAFAVINSEIYVAQLSNPTMRVYNRAGVFQRSVTLPYPVGALGGDDSPGTGPSRLFAAPTTQGNFITELNPSTGMEINRFPSPSPVAISGEMGLAFDGTNLWYISASDDTLYQVNPDTGVVVRATLITVGSGQYDGLGAVGGLIYILDHVNDQIHTFNPASNSITGSRTVAVDLLGGISGISNPDALIVGAADGSILEFSSLDTALRVFDSNGVELAVNNSGNARADLDIGDPDTAGGIIDPFIDFTATSDGTYYVGVSAEGNSAYDPKTLTGRIAGQGGTGSYSLGLQVYAPRTFVLSLANANVEALSGTTFTVTQIPDLANPVPANRPSNQLTFTIPVIPPSYRPADAIQLIADLITGGPRPLPLPNDTENSGPDGLSGPIKQVFAKGYGGVDGSGPGLRLFPTSPTATLDFNTQFSHRRGFAGGSGTTELYAWVERAANVVLSQEAINAGLRIDPVGGQNIDQLLPETGVLLTGGSSATVVNNVFSNLHQGLVLEEPRGIAAHPKPAVAIVTANVFQHIANVNNVFRRATGITPGPSNVNGGADDFNVTLTSNAPLFVDPAAGNFLPHQNSSIIDSAVDSLNDRDAVKALKLSVGIPLSNVLAPTRDNSGQLRADDPNVSSSGGLGQNVFKDRGALDRADFVGPTAVIESPRDNDAAGIDTDPADSFLQLDRGVYDEFRILLQDLGDSSDPFVGTGINDNTVVVSPIENLRARGAAVALFEGDRLLVEGVDYTFSYDTTKNIITLRPIAGIWREDRAYRIKLNNRDRIVGVAAAANQIIDGDSFAVVDNDGGRVTFEYDSGYQLVIPETLQFTVPAAGTGAGGISDGDLFSLIGVNGLPVIFEFNQDTTKLPATIQVPYKLTDTPAMIAASARTVIAAAAVAGLIDVDVDVRATGTTVVIGSDAGMILDTTNSGLITGVRTIALQIPTAGAGPAGIDDGDVLTINDGTTTVSFEFEITGGLNNPANTSIAINGAADAVLLAIQTAIRNSALRLNPVAIGNNLFLGLPINGFVTVPQGQLKPIGISRTPVDGDTITLTPASGSAVTLELSTDTAIIPGNIRVDFNRSTTADQLATKIATILQGQTISGLNAGAVQANIGGQVSIGGTAGLQLTLNEGLPVTSVPTILATGSPDVTGSTLLTISGPLLIQIPIVGGGGLPDDSQFTLSNGTTSVTFIYNLVNSGVANITATPIDYQTFEDANTLAAATVAAINASGLNIVAANLGGGLISLGPIGDNQLTFPATPAIPAPISPRRGIVNDGEQISITQNGQTRVFEFQSAVGGGSVTVGAIPVVFQPASTIADVANILAASINNNRGTLTLTATVEPGGRVRIADTAKTTTDVSLAPTITLSGQAGGAIAIPFTGSFTAEDTKRSIIDAINGASTSGKTALTAENRGGATFFIENAVFVDGPLPNYYLEAIKDVSGQRLEPTRSDNTTQFTLLLPTTGLDYGDAPDPIGGVRGRYPTLLDVDGPRHVVSDQVRLGGLVDIDTNGLPNPAANGDDTTIFVRGVSGGFFSPTVKDGFVEVAFNLTGPVSGFDGNTITVSTGVDTATLELDTNGIFNENNFPVSVSATGTVSKALIAQAFANAVRQSPLRPAAVQVSGDTARVVTDDEDGVVFASANNPLGVLNRGVPTPISVTVTGGGIVEAWIDFNFDGDFTDPGEQIIDRFTPGAVFSANTTNTPVTRQFVINIPSTSPSAASVTSTYARFRVSAEGGLSPTGLALSGEVEDYRLRILPGLPPTVNDSNRTLSYTVDEDAVLQASDADGTLTPASANDNGTLAKISDPDGDIVAVFTGDVGKRTLLDPAGATAGMLTLFDDGTFTFEPEFNFFGNTQFTFRVADVPLADPLRQLVSPVAVTVNLTVRPVNDRPFATGNTPTTTISVLEDAVQTFTTAQLTGFYSAGPANESTQTLQIQSAGVNGFGFQTALGGILTLVDGSLRYTPPANYPGPLADRFTYVVADDPNDLNQLVQSAVTQGTVIINISSVNDAPFAGTDSLSTAEDTVLAIAIGGAGGILFNDNPGPADESGQTVSLIPTDFPKATERGGTIGFGPGNATLVYTPPANFDGQDQFTYRIADNGSPSATATGTVVITVGGNNDAPVFIGINGDSNKRSLEFNESKDAEQVFNFNLSSWFSDPEGDTSTFTVTSSDNTIVGTEVLIDNATSISTLRLRLPSFRFGDLQLDIRATNSPNGPSSSVIVPVKVVNTPDPPVIIGLLDPLSAVEDETIVRDLSSIFSDPDGGQLVYRVTRLGAVLNPTAAQIAASPLVNSITFNGNQMTITLDRDASGNVDVQIAAFDGTFQITDSFKLTVTPQEDAPRAVADFYNVPIGAKFEIIDPSQGLSGNDVDPDTAVFAGTTRKVRVDLSSVTQPAKGTVVVNADGTFAYTNTSGGAGGTDTFTYRPIDPTGLVGNQVTVTFNLGRSRYQNPIPGFSFDVTANGVISPLDALRIINLLARVGSASVPVATLNTAPPDFYDVNGDGVVSARDALNVINEISRRNKRMLGTGEGESLNQRLSSTVAYAAPTSLGLKESNLNLPQVVQPANIENTRQQDPFAVGFDIVDRRIEQSAVDLHKSTQPSKSSKNTSLAVDEVLSSWFDQSIL